MHVCMAGTWTTRGPCALPVDDNVCVGHVLLQAWQSAVPRDVLEGLLAAEELRKAHNLEGVAGCLVDLLDVPPQLVTAADVVAGNQLFQVSNAAKLHDKHAPAPE